MVEQLCGKYNYAACAGVAASVGVAWFVFAGAEIGINVGCFGASFSPVFITCCNGSATVTYRMCICQVYAAVGFHGILKCYSAVQNCQHYRTVLEPTI